MGTPAYMSPEQARGEVVTTASDMYSYGLLLQTLFTGERAYPADLDRLELFVTLGSLIAEVGMPGEVLRAVGTDRTFAARRESRTRAKPRSHGRRRRPL